MRATTVALVVRYKGQSVSLEDTFSDEREIHYLENHWENSASPLGEIHERRVRQAQEEEEFGNYVEELLSQPYVRPEVQEHGVQWLKSKLRIDDYHRSEVEAAKIIADYAFKVFLGDPGRTDFYLAGPTAKVRIRVFILTETQQKTTEAA